MCAAVVVFVALEKEMVNLQQSYQAKLPNCQTEKGKVIETFCIVDEATICSTFFSCFQLQLFKSSVFIVVSSMAQSFLATIIFNLLYKLTRIQFNVFSITKIVYVCGRMCFFFSLLIKTSSHQNDEKKHDNFFNHHLLEIFNKNEMYLYYQR